jgi:hypothetical protein
MKMNSDYFVALAKTFEEQYGVEFVGHPQGPVTDPRERLIQFKTNIDVVMSVLDRNGLGDWLADRLVAIGDTVKDDFKLHFDVKAIRFWTTGCASPICRSSRKRSPSRTASRAPRSRSASRCSASPAKWPARAAAFRKSSSG